ncbi:biotin-dependent carboxyltransferase family protein [Marinicella rhabdoformis]|uniref:5-oxoprolinase subunit C family protein n=1 Tax=Marinicella rhabdoformis TaxID=2580566 RepID=UPI0012AECF52|nr:biotin-dependent carboxyltransferase family protein [Marinicella rhabdoformis]
MNQWRIIKPGLSSTFQDAGRFNLAHIGIPVSGALDLPAAHYANKLLANDLNDAVIEITMTGISFETACDCSIAITGAVFCCQINDRHVDHQQTLNLKAGDVFSMHKRHSGVRAYLAVAGGFDLPMTLGSTSTLVSAKLGGYQGRSLQANDVIVLNNPYHSPSRSVADWKRPKVHSKVTSAQAIHVIRAQPGPEYDLFDSYSQQSLWQQAFEVTQDCDRMGMRLHNEYQLKAIKTISSSGIVPGSLQVTPDGDSIMTLNDGQVTGGYPRILVVLPDQISLLAQAQPGDALYFFRQFCPI